MTEASSTPKTSSVTALLERALFSRRKWVLAAFLIITLAMYVGRLGPLTIALGLALRQRRALYRYAEERVRIG